MSKFSANSREEIERIQLAEIQKLLEEILPNNNFYNKKLHKTGIDSTIDSLDSFRENCPFTTKSELVSDHQTNSPFGSNLTFPIEQYARAHKTSGTSGHPITWLDTTQGWEWMIDSWCNIFEASGVNSKDRIFYAFSFGRWFSSFRQFD